MSKNNSTPIGAGGVADVGAIEGISIDGESSINGSIYDSGLIQIEHLYWTEAGISYTNATCYENANHEPLAPVLTNIAGNRFTPDAGPVVATEPFSIVISDVNDWSNTPTFYDIRFYTASNDELVGSCTITQWDTLSSFVFPEGYNVAAYLRVRARNDYGYTTPTTGGLDNPNMDADGFYRQNNFNVSG